MKPETTYEGRTKYSPGRARRYQTRPAAKHKAEMALLDRAFKLIPKKHRILDAPCGGGRVSIHLAGRGYQMSSADLSLSMVEIARENIAKSKFTVTVDQQDVEKFTYPDKAFDTVISFRLFHHFPNTDIRRRVVKEFCRIAGQNVALSYFSPVSFTSAKNKLKAKLGSKKKFKYTTPLAEVEGYFAECGFRLVKDFAQLPLIHTMHLAVFERSR